MSRPGIEPRSPGPLANTLTIMPIMVMKAYSTLPRSGGLGSAEYPLHYLSDAVLRSYLSPHIFWWGGEGLNPLLGIQSVYPKLHWQRLYQLRKEIKYLKKTSKKINSQINNSKNYYFLYTWGSILVQRLSIWGNAWTRWLSTIILCVCSSSTMRPRVCRATRAIVSSILHSFRTGVRAPSWRTIEKKTPKGIIFSHWQNLKK